MRWPFSFLGRGGATKGGQSEQAGSPRREWASLPAIQRTFGEAHLTAPTAAFVHSLAGTGDPGLSLGRLGHHVSLDGPPGLVSGLTRVETNGRSADLVDRPRPRREPTIQRRLFDAEETDISPSVETHAEPESAVEPAMMSYALVDEPVQQLSPLTRLADVDATAVHRMVLPRPLQEAREGPAQGDASMAPAIESQARPVAAQRLTLGQSRRLGLGAPLSHQAASTVQRSAEPPSLDLAPPTRSAPDGQVDVGHLPGSHDPEAGGADEVMSTVEHLAPITRPMIQRVTAPDDDDHPDADLPLARPAPRSAPGPGPALDHAAVQRAVATTLPPIYPRPALMRTAPIVSDRPPLLVVRRKTDSLEVGGESPEQSVLQRMPAVVAAEPLATMPKAIVRGTATPGPNREAAVPARSVPAMPPLAPVASAVQRAPSAPQDFVAFSPFADTRTPPAAHGPTPQFEIPAVQREVAPGESEAPGVVTAPAVSAAPGAAASPGQGDKELDELARKLHDRISFQLRRELLIQRERAGMVTDLR